MWPGVSMRVTHDHKLGGFEQQKLISHSSGDQKAEIEVSAGQTPSKASRENPPRLLQVLAARALPGLQQHRTHLRLHLPAPTSLRGSVSQFPSPDQDTTYAGFGAHPSPV